MALNNFPQNHAAPSPFGTSAAPAPGVFERFRAQTANQPVFNNAPLLSSTAAAATTNPAPTFGNFTDGGLFGTPQQTSTPFGAHPAPAPPAAGASIFGQASQPITTGFGFVAAVTRPNQSFGGTTTTTAGTAFGTGQPSVLGFTQQASQPQASTGFRAVGQPTLFGPTKTTTGFASPTPGSCKFGAATQQQQPSISAPTTQQSPAFGATQPGTAFGTGTTTTQPTTWFGGGSQSQPQSSTGFSGFGGSGSSGGGRLFGQPIPTLTFPTFGQPPQHAKVSACGSDMDGGNQAVSVSQAGRKHLIAKRNLIVTYLPQSFTDGQLFNLFVSYGAIDRAKVMRNAIFGFSYGYGFVEFVKEEDAIRATAEMNGAQVENKRIKVSFARPRSDDIKDTNLYVTNLPRCMSEQDLFALFAPFGDILEGKVLVDRYTNLPRGVAYIRFDRRDQAAAAINALNNYVPQGAEEPIIIRLAVNRGKQKAAALAGFRAGMGLPTGPPGGAANPLNVRSSSWNSYSSERPMEGWNYERRRANFPSWNPTAESYWTTDGNPAATDSTPYFFPGSHNMGQHPYCESDYVRQSKRN